MKPKNISDMNSISYSNQMENSAKKLINGPIRAQEQKSESYELDGKNGNDPNDSCKKDSETEDGKSLNYFQTMRNLIHEDVFRNQVDKPLTVINKHFLSIDERETNKEIIENCKNPEDIKALYLKLRASKKYFLNFRKTQQ